MVVIAKDIEHMKQLVNEAPYVEISDEDIEKVITYPLKGKHEPKVFVFPDAGCC